MNSVHPAENENLRGRVAVITGAGQGMGRSVAEALAARNAALVVSDVRQDAAEELAKKFRAAGASCISVPADVSKAVDVTRLMAAARKEFGAVHILINNAGVLRPTPVVDISEEEWDFVLDVNLKGTFLCTRAALPSMIEAKWGRIVNFSSTAGKNVSTIGGAHYTAAKAGILGLTRHTAKEVAALGITVNSVCPGLIETEMVRTTISADRIAAYARIFPAQRLGQSWEVATLVAFLCSDRAAYITGASLDINGGDLMI